MSAKLAGGIIEEIKVEADGIDLKIKAGCGGEAPGCRGACGRCWTKVAPTNFTIGVGMVALWSGNILAVFDSVQIGPLMARKLKFKVERIGKYRRIRPDGTCKPAPTRTFDVDCTAPPPFPVDPAAPPNASTLHGDAGKDIPPGDDTPTA